MIYQMMVVYYVSNIFLIYNMSPNIISKDIKPSLYLKRKVQEKFQINVI